MRNSLTRLSATLFQFCLRKSNPSRLHAPLTWLLVLGLTVFGSVILMPRQVQAESLDAAPAQLTEALQLIDAAANKRDLKTVLQFYGKNFKGADGLTRQSLSNALSEFWKRFQGLNYRTELKSWETENQMIVAETITYITGTQTLAGRKISLNATLHSRQHYSDNKIVQQEILAERSQLSFGQSPPTLSINLPETVRVGQPFNFDAIVQEPLGDDLLLGAALEEPVKVDGYVKATPIDLELLPAGGIFKLGRAPYSANNHWLSAVILRGDGMSAVTQRLRVTRHGR